MKTAVSGSGTWPQVFIGGKLICMQRIWKSI